MTKDDSAGALRQEAISAYAESCPSGKTGHVTLLECPICGDLAWISTDPSKPVGASVQQMRSLDLCGSCMAVASRAPEVFHWVRRVVAHAAAQPEAMRPNDPDGFGGKA